MERLTAERVRIALGRKHRELSICVLPTVESTNLSLKQRAREGTIAAPYLLLAGQQTAGRGRLGRAFLSPEGTGLYMSLLLPLAPGADTNRLTILAAVAVCRAIEESCPLKPAIKWVNDIFVRGKKVCGILAEGLEKHVVVGIGLNIRTPEGGFPDDLPMAGALDAELSRAKLAGKIAAYMLDGAENLSDPGIVEQYRARMPLTGREIRYTMNGQEKSALVLGVDRDGGLIVAGKDGQTTLRHGEVTLGSGAFIGLE